MFLAHRLVMAFRRFCVLTESDSDSGFCDTCRGATFSDFASSRLTLIVEETSYDLIFD